MNSNSDATLDPQLRTPPVASKLTLPVQQPDCGNSTWQPVRQLKRAAARCRRRCWTAASARLQTIQTMTPETWHQAGDRQGHDMLVSFDRGEGDIRAFKPRRWSFFSIHPSAATSNPAFHSLYYPSHIPSAQQISHRQDADDQEPLPPRRHCCPSFRSGLGLLRSSE